MTKIKVLEGLVPICSSCKKIRDQNHQWQPIETYLESRSDALFTHGLASAMTVWKNCMGIRTGTKNII